MKNKIVNYEKAGYPGLYIVSHEESRVEGVMKEVLVDLNKSNPEDPFTLHAWSVTDGVVEVSEGTKTKDTEDPLAMLEAFHKAPQKTIFLARDFHLMVEDRNPLVWRKLKDALAVGKANN